MLLALRFAPILLVALATPAASATLTRGPYLQLLTAQSVTIVWNTDVSAPCSLTIRPVGGATSTVRGETSKVCAVTVDGLTPGTRYGYVPRADGAALAAETIFRSDDPTGAYSFLVIGDSGTGGTKQHALGDRMLATPADFILHTGDMVYDDGAAEDFDAKFFRPYGELIARMVLWPTLGNHDIHTAGGEPWRDAFWTPANNPARTENYYSFDAGNAHVVILNSNASLSPGSAQYTFLDRDLAATTKLWKVVAFHHTIYSGGKHGSSSIRDDVVPLFDRYGVDLVFMGHDHHYERTFALRQGRVVEDGAGTVYVTTGGGGQTIRAVTPSSFTAYAESAFHYVRAAVDGGSLLLQMIRDDGVVRDQTVFVKNGTTPPAARCGDGLVNRPSEQCDGADRPACTGACTADCRCVAVCGDGLVNQAAEQCDGADDQACTGRCLSSCRCGAAADFVTLPAVADTHVQALEQATWDHGIARDLDVDLSPESLAYLKFDLRGVSRPVVRATLNLRCTNGSYDGGTVYPVADSSWIEGDRTGADATSADGPGLRWVDVDTNGDGDIDVRDTSPWVPDLRAPAGSITSLSAAAISVDVTSALGGGGALRTLAIKNDSTDGAAYASREDPDAADRPSLRLELGTAGATTTTTTPPQPTTTRPSTTVTTTTIATTTTTTTVPSSSPAGLVTADVTVHSGAPNTNFGGSATLDADTSPAEWTLFRISVSGVAGRTVQSARLRLQVADVYGAPSDVGGRIRAVPSCGWDENTVTWNTRPTPATGEVDRVGAVGAGDAVDFELAPVIRGDGVWCFALDTSSDNGVIYNSREAGAGRPAVILTIGSSPTTPTTTTSTTSTTVRTTTTTTLPTTVHSVTEADTIVIEQSKDANYGSEPVLEVDREPRTRAFLRVRVSGIGKRRVSSAHLQLRVASQPGAASDSGGKVSWIEDCSWDEHTATWKVQPNRGGKELAKLGDVAAGELVEIDATQFVGGDGAYCFMIETDSKNAVMYEARESASGGSTIDVELAP